MQGVKGQTGQKGKQVSPFLFACVVLFSIVLISSCNFKINICFHRATQVLLVHQDREALQDLLYVLIMLIPFKLQNENLTLRTENIVLFVLKKSNFDQ